jgi:hypothetical protein
MVTFRNYTPILGSSNVKVNNRNTLNRRYERRAMDAALLSFGSQNQSTTVTYNYKQSDSLAIGALLGLGTGLTIYFWGGIKKAASAVGKGIATGCEVAAKGVAKGCKAAAKGIATGCKAVGNAISSGFNAVKNFFKKLF